MVKHGILYIDEDNSINIKVKSVYSSNSFTIHAKKFLNSINSDEEWHSNHNHINNDEPIFIGSNCKVSRFKVREHAKITYSIHKAEVLFFNTDANNFTAENFVNTNFYSSKNFAKIGESVHQFNELLLLDSESTKKHYNKLKNFRKLYRAEDWLISVDDGIVLRDILMRELNIDRSDTGYNLRNISYSSGKYFYPSDKLGFDFLDENLRKAKLTSKILDVHHLKKSINAGGLPITKDSYDELRKMISSGSDDNITLAMEIMANAKFDESFHYLFLLCIEYGNSVIQESHAYNHINFKSFRNTFLELGNRELCSFYQVTNWIGYNLDFAVKSLVKLDQYTQEKMEMIIEFLQPDTLLNSEYYEVDIIEKETEDQ